MAWYIRTITTSGATAYDTLDAAVGQARATLKLQAQRGRQITDEKDRKVIRDGHQLIDSMWIEDEEGTTVRFVY